MGRFGTFWFTNKNCGAICFHLDSVFKNWHWSEKEDMVFFELHYLSSKPVIYFWSLWRLYDFEVHKLEGSLLKMVVNTTFVHAGIFQPTGVDEQQRSENIKVNDHLNNIYITFVWLVDMNFVQPMLRQDLSSVLVLVCHWG